MECLQSAIGISQTECECLIGHLPDNYQVSDSGLYMDELPESPITLAAIKSIEDCGNDMPKILTNARTQAISEFKRDLFKLMQSRFVLKSKPYHGDIGKRYFTSTLSTNNSYLGMKLTTKAIRGANLTIKSIAVCFDTTLTFPLSIYKKVDGSSQIEFLVQVTDLQAEAGTIKVNQLEEEIVLPLADGSKSITYYLVYESGEFAPKNNDSSCGCGSEDALRAFVAAKGIRGNDLEDLNIFTPYNYSHGLVLDVDAMCGNDDLICQNLVENEFIRVAVYWCLLRKAVELLIRAVLKSDSVNRYTMAKREQMGYTASGLAKKYNNDMQWVAENISMHSNDCYSCNEQNTGYQVTGILL
jgi:hypothetical protein